MTRDEKFWKAFARDSELLRDLIEQNRLREAFERIEIMLLANDFDFAFEITSDSEDAVLVLSPEADGPTAAIIDRLISERPEIPHWRFFGRRQRKSLADALVFVQRIHGLDVSDAKFRLTTEGERVHVTMCSEMFDGLPDEERESVALTFLFHGVGEEAVMSRIESVEGASLTMGMEELLSADEAVRLIVGE